MPASLKAATEKRSREGVLFMVCPVCRQPMKKTRSTVARTKTPTCGRKCRSVMMSRENNPRFGTGIWQASRSGYRFLKTDRLPESDLSLLPTPRPRDVVEHRMVMARSLGRALKRTEMVHHRNGVKNDNRLENLVLTDWAEHSKVHREIERKMAVLLEENRRLRARVTELEQLAGM